MTGVYNIVLSYIRVVCIMVPVHSILDVALLEDTFMESDAITTLRQVDAIAGTFLTPQCFQSILRHFAGLDRSEL